MFIILITYITLYIIIYLFYKYEATYLLIHNTLQIISLLIDFFDYQKLNIPIQLSIKVILILQKTLLLLSLKITFLAFLFLSFIMDLLTCISFFIHKIFLFLLKAFSIYIRIIARYLLRMKSF